MNGYALMKRFGIGPCDEARRVLDSSRVEPVFSAGNIAVYRVSEARGERLVVRRMVGGGVRFDCDCGSGGCPHSAAIEMLSAMSEDPAGEEDDPSEIEALEWQIDEAAAGWCLARGAPFPEPEAYAPVLKRIAEDVRDPSNALLLLDRLCFECAESVGASPLPDLLKERDAEIGAMFRCADPEILRLILSGGGRPFWGTGYIRCVPVPVARELFGSLGGGVDRRAYIAIGMRAGEIDRCLMRLNGSPRALQEMLACAAPGSPEAYECGWRLVERSRSVDPRALIDILGRCGMPDLKADACRELFLRTMETSYLAGAAEDGVYAVEGLLREAADEVMRTGRYTSAVLRVLIERGMGHAAERIVEEHADRLLKMGMSDAVRLLEALRDGGFAKGFSAGLGRMLRGRAGRRSPELDRLVSEAASDPVLGPAVRALGGILPDRDRPHPDARGPA